MNLNKIQKHLQIQQKNSNQGHVQLSVIFYLTKRLADGGEAIGKDKLNPKQQAFADFYIELGNAEEAALKAGYSKAYARGKAYTLLANVGIKSYIDERMEQITSERVANQQEILETLTEILRGEATAATLRGIGEGAQTIEEEMPPTMSERIRAAELLGKRYRMWTDKVDIEHSGELDAKLDLSKLSDEELRKIANSIKEPN